MLICGDVKSACKLLGVLPLAFMLAACSLAPNMNPDQTLEQSLVSPENGSAEEAPIDFLSAPATFRGFASAIFLPILIWVVQQLLSRFI